MSYVSRSKIQSATECIAAGVASVLVPNLRLTSERFLMMGDITAKGIRMIPQILLAVLTDVSGRVLLVHRKDSPLWTLPGGIVRNPVDSRATLLAVCCRRQIGITPDFVAPLTPMLLSGQPVAIGVDEIAAGPVRACGRVVDVRWFESDALPVDVAPMARLAIATHVHRVAETATVSCELEIAC